MVLFPSSRPSPGWMLNNPTVYFGLSSTLPLLFGPFQSTRLSGSYAWYTVPLAPRGTAMLSTLPLLSWVRVYVPRSGSLKPVCWLRALKVLVRVWLPSAYAWLVVLPSVGVRRAIDAGADVAGGVLQVRHPPQPIQHHHVPMLVGVARGGQRIAGTVAHPRHVAHHRIGHLPRFGFI